MTLNITSSSLVQVRDLHNPEKLHFYSSYNTMRFGITIACAAASAWTVSSTAQVMAQCEGCLQVLGFMPIKLSKETLSPPGSWCIDMYNMGTKP